LNNSPTWKKLERVVLEQFIRPIERMEELDYETRKKIAG